MQREPAHPGAYSLNCPIKHLVHSGDMRTAETDRDIPTGVLVRGGAVCSSAVRLSYT